MAGQLGGSGTHMETGQAARSATMPGEPVTGAAADGVVSHQALFYRGQHDYLAHIEAFAGAGLAMGEAVFIAVPGQRASMLRDHLGERVSCADMARLGRNPARIIA